jgi:ACR3 family arsenite transporter
MSISVLAKSQSVGIYLGIPFALGIISRYALIHLKGEDWFQNKYVLLSHQLLCFIIHNCDYV